MRICCALVLVTVCCVAQESARSISGTVADRSGAVMPDATITLSGSTSVVVKSDDRGKFVLSIREPGMYKLKFEMTDFVPKTLDVTINDGPISLDEVVLDIGITHCPTIVIDASDLLRTDGSISGAVRHGSAGVVNALVILQLSGESHPVKIAYTDANGNFQLDGVKPALYDLAIETGWGVATVDSIALQAGHKVVLPTVHLVRSATRVR